MTMGWAAQARTHTKRGEQLTQHQHQLIREEKGRKPGQLQCVPSQCQSSSTGLAIAKRALPACLLVHLPSDMGSLRDRERLATMLSCRCVAKLRRHPLCSLSLILGQSSAKAQLKTFRIKLMSLTAGFRTQN